MAPMCANMNRLAFVPLDANVQQLPQWEPDCQEDVTPLYHGDASKARLKGDYHARRKMYFKKSERQQAWPSNVAFQGNFVNPYLQFDNGAFPLHPSKCSVYVSVNRRTPQAAEELLPQPPGAVAKGWPDPSLLCVPQ